MTGWARCSALALVVALAPSGFSQVVQVLLDEGKASLEHLDAAGSSALLKAAREGYEEARRPARARKWTCCP